MTNKDFCERLKGSNNMKKRIFIILFFTVSVFIMVSLAYSSDKRFDVPLADSPSLGPADAPVTIIEFLDYQ